MGEYYKKLSIDDRKGVDAFINHLDISGTNPRQNMKKTIREKSKSKSRNQSGGNKKSNSRGRLSSMPKKPEEKRTDAELMEELRIECLKMFLVSSTK